jgi:hypothetical protein
LAALRIHAKSPNHSRNLYLPQYLLFMTGS